MPTRGTHGVQKWYIKANHPVEASRWVQALSKSIEWARKEAERQSVDSDVSSLLTPSTRAASVSFTRRSQHNLESATSDDGRDANGSPPRPREPSSDEHDTYAKSQETEGSSSLAESEHNPPYNSSFDLHANTTVAQMGLTSDLLLNLPVAASTSAGDLKSALVDAFNTANNMLTEYVQMVREREDWWKDKLDRERERQNVWEESLQAVVREGEIMEKELRNKARRRSKTLTMDSSGYLTASEMGTLRNRPSALGLAGLEGPLEAVESPEPTPVPTVTAPVATPTPTKAVPTPLPAENIPTSIVVTPTASASTIRQGSMQGSLSRRLSSMASPPPRPFSLLMGATSPKGDEEEIDTDEEDEFFDAIESNTLPNLVITDSLAGRNLIEMPSVIDQSQYNGYAKLRKSLSITSDDRPPMSLWAVLKNSIGKDLTKISFPVFFNEPTSMLQRMVSKPNDHRLSLSHVWVRRKIWSFPSVVSIQVVKSRYTKPLTVLSVDAAALEKNAHRRIAYVAAFAMSNYSSTIGRIAKPFNPMLVSSLL